MEAEAAKILLGAATGPQVLTLGDEHQAVVLPEGWQVQDISKMLPPSARIKQRVELLTLESFVAYVLKFRVAGTAIFADETAATFDAALDYHSRESAPATPPTRGACEHIGRYACPQSEQWKLWKGSDGKKVPQAEFARFIEDNLVDIMTPPSGDMLQVVLSLQVHKAADFKSEIRLDNGQTQLQYEETIRGSTRGGDLVIPDTFGLGIPVFIDGPSYPVQCRLRYRLDEGKLAMWYELVRPNDVYRAAVKEVSDSIRKQLADTPFWIGKRS
jgi:uncharacterized protein YfdQ (DUF2303 family)